jgi:hypothetical protein
MEVRGPRSKHDVAVMTMREFSSEHMAGDTPCLITDGLAGWPAMERWRPETIADIASGLVDVDISPFRFPTDGEENPPKLRDVPFKEAAELILRSTADGPKYYLFAQNMRRRLPGLLADINFPPLPTPVAQINLWFGSPGTITHLHFDGSDNFFGQCYGLKHFTLFSPDQAPYLYPYPLGSRVSHASFVDVGAPDLGKHPLFARAEPIHLTVRPGEMLFLPAFWWHYVTSEGIAISTNCWWPPTLSQCRNKTGVRILRSEYKRDRLETLCKFLQLSGPSLLLAANELRDFSVTGAVLFLLAAANAFNVSVSELQADPRVGRTWNAIVSAVERDEESFDEVCTPQEVEALLNAFAECVGRTA